MDPNQTQNPPPGVSPLNQNPNPPAEPVQEAYSAVKSVQEDYRVPTSPSPVGPENNLPEPTLPAASVPVSGSEVNPQPIIEQSDLRPPVTTVVASVPPFSDQPPKVMVPPEVVTTPVAQSSGPESFQQYNSPFEQGQGTVVSPPPMSFPPVQEKTNGRGIRRIIPLIIGALVIVLGLFVAFKFLLPPTPQEKEVTLTYWGLWESENIMAPIISEFEKNNPKIKITYKRQNSQEYRERLSSAIAQGKSPDIFRFHNSWVPMFAGDLDPIPAKVMDNGTFEKLYYPVARQDLRVGSSYVGIPLMIDGLGMFINEDIFRTAGLTPPKTWDELPETAKLLTTPINRSRGNIQIAGVALGQTGNIDHWSDILAVMMLQNNTDLANPSSCTRDQSLNRDYCYGADVLAYFTMFSKSLLVWDDTLPSSTKYFTAGKLAIYFGPSWEAVGIKEANPQLKFRILPIPQVKDAKTNLTWASYWVEGVWKKSENKEAAWKFLQFLSQKETMQKLYDLEVKSDKSRLFGEPYSRTDMADLVKESEYVGPFVKQAPAAQSWYLSSRTFDNGINDKMIKYYGDAVNSVNAGTSPRDALLNVTQGITQTLNQYKVTPR